MKVNKRDKFFIDEESFTYNGDRQNIKSSEKILKEISYFLEHCSNLTSRDYYKMICNFYDVRLENNDYIDYVKFKTGNQFDNIIKLETDVIDSYQHIEGFRKDLSWWTVKERLCLYVLVNDFEDTDKYFTIYEVKNLINENKVYPLCSFYQECDDRLYENRVKNDIEYIIKTVDFGKLNIDMEFFDYFVKDVVNEIDLNEIFMFIRKYLVSQKIYLECYLKDCCFEDYDEEKENLDIVDKLIDNYNEKIKLLSLDDKNELISKNSVEIVVDYIQKLSNMNKCEWYQDIEIEQVVKIISMIDYDEELDLCSKIEKMIIDLGDPELCYLMISDIDWIDFDKMIKVIFDSENEWVAYDMISNLSDQLDRDVIRKLIKIVVDSEDAELNYELATSGLDFIDTKEHARAVIDSGNVDYNYLFALNVPDADVRAHGEVVMEYGSAYENSEFITYVRGADVEKHREIIRLKTEEEENKNSLKKTRKK